MYFQENFSEIIKRMRAIDFWIIFKLHLKLLVKYLILVFLC